MEVLAGNGIDGRISRQASQGERDSLIKTDEAPYCPGVRKFFSNRLLMLSEASVFGASAMAFALPWLLGNRVCNTSKFEFGSPLSIAAGVLMPVSFLCYVGSTYLRMPEKIPLDSDEDSELSQHSEKNQSDMTPVIYTAYSNNRQKNRDAESSDSGSDLKFRDTCDDEKLLEDYCGLITNPVDNKVGFIYEDYTSQKPGVIKSKQKNLEKIGSGTSSTSTSSTSASSTSTSSASTSSTSASSTSLTNSTSSNVSDSDTDTKT